MQEGFCLLQVHVANGPRARGEALEEELSMVRIKDV